MFRASRALKICSSTTFRAAYDGLLHRYPYSTKALSTGVTYICSDVTAQSFEECRAKNSGNESSETASSRGLRAVKFGAVGCFWVGPLLTAWFNFMDFIVPGKHLRPIVTNLIVDQVLQGPFMIGTMYLWTALANGSTLAQARQRMDELLFPTWVNSVIVWGPVQICQQAFIPLQYRVLVANIVSYFWDTYLSYMMMTSKTTPDVNLQSKASGNVAVAAAPESNADEATRSPR